MAIYPSKQFYVHQQQYSSNVSPEDQPKEKRSFSQILKACLKNEVTWGIFTIICSAIIIIIIWIVKKRVEWQLDGNFIRERGRMAIIGGIFAITASFMSFVQIIQHFFNKTHHPSQRRIMRILAMIPIYAMTSWISILFFHSAIYMELIKSCLEAYVIYCFLILLTKYLGGHRGVEEVIITKNYIELPFPFSCIKPKPNLRWVWYFKIGLLQYTWINPLCASIAVVLNLAEVYANGEWKFNRGFPYIIIIINLSQTVALYSLVTFYTNAKTELQPFKPLAKFIVIKLIVFFIFWQTVFMSGLAALHVLGYKPCNDETNPECKNHANAKLPVEEEKILLENTIICVEMFFFSIAHHWIFSWKPYADGTFKRLMESRYRYMNNRDDPENDIISTCF